MIETYGIKQLGNILKDAKAIVTDSTVQSLYGDLLSDAYAFPAGESSKNADTLFGILKHMHDVGFKRGDTLYAVGGGVVGDVAGLAAALYMRGVKFEYVPTTLLAIVDSSIGGKTAIDFDGVKNLVGAFKMPNRVYVCPDFLKTLSPRERLCGAGEMIKTCMLTAQSFELLKNNIDFIKAFVVGVEYDRRITDMLIEACVKIKSTIVRRDPYESGLRKILNLGHTVGHALESINGYDKSHGEYVVMGIMTELAMLKEYVDGNFYCTALNVLKEFAAPPKSTVGGVLKAAESDKKNSDGLISIMLATRAGDISEFTLTSDQFKDRYDSALKELRA